MALTTSAQWGSETGWSGSGGGCSAYFVPARGFAKPSWQSDSSCISRASPDIAANADPNTGYLFYYGGLFVVGGTSVAAPVWAGIMADINQGRAVHGLGVEGFPNIDIYAAGASTTPPFHDIVAGSNGAYEAIRGWDAVTGWGSPDTVRVASVLGAVSVSLSASPSSATPGSTVTASWANIPTPSSTDWIGLYPTAAPDALANRLDFFFVNCQKSPTTAAPSGSCGFSAPSSTGAYEFRLFTNNTLNRLVTSAAFSV